MEEKEISIGGGSMRNTEEAPPSVPAYSNDREEDRIVTKSNGDEELKFDPPKFIQWITHGSGIYFPEFHVQLTKTIPAGYYGIGFNGDVGKYFVRKILYTTDNILKLPMPEIGKVMKDITTFWKKEEAFKRYGLTYKRGVLLYGPPGCGKTHLIQLIIKELIEQQNGIVFKIESGEDVERYSIFMQSTFKIIEPKRRIVTMIEDIDGLFHSGKATETLLLNILDGMNQMDNIVYVATTNYPEELAERIVNRPSRFDRRYEITIPNPEVREFYLRNTLKSEDLNDEELGIDIDEWVKQTEGLSIAHLRELIVSTVIQGNTFEETIEILKDFNTKTPTSKKFGGKGNIGFSQSK